MKNRPQIRYSTTDDYAIERTFKLFFFTKLDQHDQEYYVNGDTDYQQTHTDPINNAAGVASHIVAES